MGAILGIILGRKGLPEKWVAPLGDEITTNVGTGGIKNLKAPTMKAKVIYHDRAAVVGDAPTRLTLVVENPHSEPLQAKVSADLPRLEEDNESWQLASSLPAKIDIPATGEVAIPMAITCPPDSIGLSN